MKPRTIGSRIATYALALIAIGCCPVSAASLGRASPSGRLDAEPCRADLSVTLQANLGVMGPALPNGGSYTCPAGTTSVSFVFVLTNAGPQAIPPGTRCTMVIMRNGVGRVNTTWTEREVPVGGKVAPSFQVACRDWIPTPPAVPGKTVFHAAATAAPPKGVIDPKGRDHRATFDVTVIETK